RQSICVAALGTALPPGVPQADQIRTMRGGISIGDDVNAEFKITSTDAPSATQLAKLLRAAIDQGKNFLTVMAMNQKELTPLVEVMDAMKVTEQGSEIDVKGHVSKEFFDQLNAKH